MHERHACASLMPTAQLEQLNALVWPAIRTQIETELAGWRAAGTRLAILEATVLLEAEWDDLCGTPR